MMIKNDKILSMAEHVLNQNIEFFYSDDSCLKDFFDELNQRFCYQKIIVVGENQSLKDYFLKTRKSLLIDMIFCENLDFSCSQENVVCVVCTDATLVENARKFCFENNKFLTIFASEYFSLSNFVRQKNMANILGLAFEKNAIIKNFDRFKIEFFLDKSSLIFNSLENMLCNLFLQKTSDSSQKTRDFDEILHNFALEYDETINLYVALIKVFYAKNFDFLDYFISSNSVFVRNGRYHKLVLTEVIFNIYDLFLNKITRNLKRVMNGENLILPSKSFDDFNNFSSCFSEENFWFVKQKFGDLLSTEILNHKKQINELKKACLLTSVEETHSIMKNENFDSLKTGLKQSTLKFDGSTFLKVVNFFGYLDF